MDINSNEPQATNSEIESVEMLSTEEVVRGTSSANPRMGALTPEITVELEDDSPSDVTGWCEPAPSSVVGLLKFTTEADRVCAKRREAAGFRKTPAAPRRRSNIEEPYVFSLAQASLGSTRIDLRRLSDPGNRRKRSEDLDKWEVPVAEGRSVMLGGRLSPQSPGAENQATSDPCCSGSPPNETESRCIGRAQSLPWTSPAITIPSSTAAVAEAIEASAVAERPKSAGSLSTRVRGLFLCLPEIPLRRRSLSLECARLEAIAEENVATATAAKSSRRYSSPATTKSEV